MALSTSPSAVSLLSASSVLSSDSERETPGSTPNTGSENGDAAPFGPEGVTMATTIDKLRRQLPLPAKDGFILVTGGLGYIGSHTALELMKEGYNVIIVDNLSNSFASTRWRIQHLAAQHCKAQGRSTPQLHFHRLDYQNTPMMRLVLEQYCAWPYGNHFAKEPDAICSQTLLGSSHGDGSDSAQLNSASPCSRSQISGVIHFAAYKSVEESISNPLGYYDNNVCGFVGFIGLLAEFDIRSFIFSSSATVYGSKANAEKPLREDDVIHRAGYCSEKHAVVEPSVEGLTCTYARTKYFCEAILADVARADPQWRIVALRYFNPVGCDPSGLLGETPRTKPTNLFPIIGEVLRGARPALSVFGQDWPTRDGTAIRDYIHVADIARGHVAALAGGYNRDWAGAGEAFRTYNLGSGTGTSVLEIVNSLEEAAQRPVPIEWTGRRAGDVGFCIASTTRAKEELGWQPRETIAQSARDLWNHTQKWHRIEE